MSIPSSLLCCLRQGSPVKLLYVFLCQLCLLYHTIADQTTGPMSGLMIVGIPLRTGDKYVPHLTMRRIFNTKCFREERYRHEIANHYRDYKMQMQRHQLNHSTHRQRQRQRQRHLHRRPNHPHRLETSSFSAASLASQYTQFRGVWPTHVHYFPRFGDTYAPRGRQTICSGEPPDETYNATVRLIKRAESCEQLKELVQRQLRHRRQRRQQRHQRQQLQNAADDDNNEDDDDDDSDNSNTINNNNNNNSTKTSGQRDHGGSNSVRRNHYKLNINKNKVENLQRQQQQQQEHQQQQRRRIDFYTYLQLANGYYEQGLQANIKYLESIGKRNAIKTKQQQQQQQQLSDTIEGAALPLVKLLKGWRRQKHTSDNSCSPSAESDAISVHIRPSTLQQQQEFDEHSNINCKLTMCDYVAQSCSNKVNNATNSSSNSNSNSLISPTTTGSTIAIIDQCKFYEIIDNLSQLSLTNETNIDRLQLPLITLTDYTQQVATNQQQQQQHQQQQQLHIPNEARPPKNLTTTI